MQNEEESKPFDLGVRTKQFALRIIKLFQALPETTEARVLGKQILRSGTSEAPSIEKPKGLGLNPSSNRKSKAHCKS
jgi:four helix bundle protein